MKRLLVGIGLIGCVVAGTGCEVVAPVSWSPDGREVAYSARTVDDTRYVAIHRLDDLYFRRFSA